MPRARSRALAALALLALFALVATACDHYAAAGVASGSPVTPHLTPAPVRAVETDPACASPSGADVPITVDLLRTGEGACVPPAEALVYRCDPTFDPMAVLDVHGTQRRYLGGRYAVPLDGLPAGAHRIGIGTSGRLYEIPGVPPALVVETEGTYERWLALPDPAFVGSTPEATLIGDSIADGASQTLDDRLSTWSLTIDAEIGRTSSGGVAPAEAILGLPDAVVFELGVNDTSADAFATNAQASIDAVRDADLIVWVTAHGPEPETDAVDRAIVEAMGGIANGAVADWDTAVPPEALSSDGVHLLDGAGTEFVDFLAPFLETWRDAVTGHGPDRCGAQLTAGL